MSTSDSHTSPEQTVERVTVSLTSATAQHPKVRTLVKLKRFSFYVEGLITADLEKAGALREEPAAGEPSTTGVGA